MEKQRPSIILHLDSLDVLDKLTLEQSGELFQAIRDYNKGEEPKMSMVVDLVFTQFKNQFDRDIEKYQNICERNKSNGKKGGRPVTQKTQVVNQETQNNPNNLKNKNKSKNKNKNNSKKDIGAWQPNQTSIDAIKKQYPSLSQGEYQNLVEDFIERAANREKPFKDFDMGFKQYLRKGWITPYRQTNQQSHSQRLAQEMRDNAQTIDNPLIMLGSK